MDEIQYNKDILREEGFEYHQIGVQKSRREDYGHIGGLCERK